MDFYEALPFTVAELPFRKMTAYPYPEKEHYPEDPARTSIGWSGMTGSIRARERRAMAFTTKTEGPSRFLVLTLQI